MWSGQAPGKWQREEGYLHRVGLLVAEMHMHAPGQATVHVYRFDPDALTAALPGGLTAADVRTGGPLDDCVHVRTYDVEVAPGNDAAAFDRLAVVLAQEERR